MIWFCTALFPTHEVYRKSLFRGRYSQMHAELFGSHFLNCVVRKNRHNCRFGVLLYTVNANNHQNVALEHRTKSHSNLSKVQKRLQPQKAVTVTFRRKKSTRGKSSKNKKTYFVITKRSISPRENYGMFL